MRRRTFSALAAAVSYKRILGANERAGVALVGSGRRGRDVMAAMIATDRAELRVICDVYDQQRRQAREALVAGGAASYECVAIEDALARREVDAALIATPDHLHLTHARAALAAGKHVYLEKPTTHRFAEAEPLREAVRGSGKILQCGMQQRSGLHYMRAREEIFARGRLGKLLFVRSNWSDFPWQTRLIQPQPKPPGLDWERFLGPAQKREWQRIRYDSWRYFPEYGGGLLADIMTHWVDVAQWMTDETAPSAAMAGGGIYHLRDGRENPDTVNAIVEYGKRWNFTFESTVLPVKERPAILFLGTEGSLDITRDGYTFQPAKGAPQTVRAAGNLDRAHAANFLDAIAGKAAPNAGIETGIQACNPVHLARASYWQRRRMRWEDLR